MKKVFVVSALLLSVFLSASESEKSSNDSTRGKDKIYIVNQDGTVEFLKK